MSKYFDAQESANESFLGADKLSTNSDEWLQSKLEAKDVFQRLTDPISKTKFINALNAGLIRSYAEHAYIEWTPDSDKTFGEWPEFKRWVRNHRLYGNGGGEQAFHYAMRLPTSFWEHDHCKNSDWHGGFNDWFPDAIAANWKTGEFGAAYVRGAVLDPDAGFQSLAVGYSIFYKVRFQAADVDAVLGPAQDEVIETRRSKYNWEGAIAAFCAAQWKHDIVSDVYAHGAQAEIEKWLATWLSRNKTEASERSIRDRARLLLQSMQRADKA